MTSIAHVAYRWIVKTIATFVVVLSILVVVAQAGQPDDCKKLLINTVQADADRAAANAACGEVEWLDYLTGWGEVWTCHSLDERADSSESARDATQSNLENVPCASWPMQFRLQLPAAVLILCGIIFVPLLIKMVFYFWLAPRAERLPPIRIMPRADAPAVPRPQSSAVSTSVELGSDDELLLHPDFVQSSDRSARKQTQWLLNPRLPLSSLASGMVSLTRIRAPDQGTTQIVVSSQKDSLSEVAVIEVPAGAGMVIQPRSLAGVVKRIGSPVKITAEWRLGSLNAWLTLQLRYLVFHGPCSLIVKGCRGIRAEQPAPGKPRLINQAATLGFSANLDYSIARCETFVSYLRGQEDLFNDLFSGGPGLFIYEEVPDSREKGGVTGKGLEGVVDAFLKAFGI